MAKRGRPRKTEQGLAESMIEMGYMATIPGLDLAIQELQKLRDSITALLRPQRNPARRLPAQTLEPFNDLHIAEDTRTEAPETTEPLRLLDAAPATVKTKAKALTKAGSRFSAAGREEHRRKTSEAVAYRWRVVKDAGLRLPERGSPNRELVARAEKILARRESRAAE